MGVDVHDLQKEEDERREKVLSEMGLRIGIRDSTAGPCLKIAKT